MVPACRTLDCVSVFALTVDDAFAALAAMAGAGCAPIPIRALVPLGALGAMPASLRLGVPLPGQRQFFGDTLARKPTTTRCPALHELGRRAHRDRYRAILRAARMLYEGPWVAERYIAARSVVASAPQASTR